ncbi:hypothetical protein GGR93_000708 [Sulfitobacter noctilucicola]|uniref:Uncharacterized protein n=1 Tax=Sulfitobacter noctilucicola TaxID=1342301 RepID=A0A7W6M6D1_9RHOB|nr:hypothetical protein [Sulfitobacter noctilucicola]
MRDVLGEDMINLCANITKWLKINHINNASSSKQVLNNQHECGYGPEKRAAEQARL